MFNVRILLGLAFLATPAAAQEKHTIKQRHDTKGDSVTVVREEEAKEDVRLLDPDGKEVQKKTQTTIILSRFRQDINEKVAGAHPTKITRVYDNAEIRIGDRVRDLAFKGKTVLIEKAGDKFRFTADNKPLEQDLDILLKEFDPKKPTDEETEKLFFPAKAVAEGETWVIDAKAVLGRMAGSPENAAKNYDVGRAKASGTLTKAYKKDGISFSVIDIEVVIPLKLFAEKFPCKEGATVTLKLTGDIASDGSRGPAKTKAVSIQKGKAEVLQKDQPTGATIVFDIISTRTSNTTPVKK